VIALVSCLLAAYEALAYLTPLPKVTTLSHRRPWAFLVWGWLLWLFIHFILEANRDRQTLLRSRTSTRR
jgi:uncharacterized RDD family membrane protein YckC